MSSDDISDAIAAYRNQLREGAELADGDLDEIEDHLRALTDDLRATGMPAATAVTEAARRLGEPRAIAREHNRVRSAFGSRLSRMRTWSVVALLLPMLVIGVVNVYPHWGLWNRFMLETLLGAVLLGALVLRFGWARPILLGGLAFFMIPSATSAYQGWVHPAHVLWHLSLIAFLAPWQRGEITRTGLALAAHVWAYGAASYAAGFMLTTDDGSWAYFAPAALVACGAAALATVGAVLRARWSTFAGVVAAFALGAAAYQLALVDFGFDHPILMAVALWGTLISGAAAAVVGSVLAWSSARSSFGSLRAIRS